ncbi:MAG TPA: DoxX family membrane protein [Chitinophagaceae bacterium]
MWFKDFESTFLPRWLIWTAAYYTFYVELIGGILLIVGLFKRVALYLLAVDLLIISFSHGLPEPIWDLLHVMLRAILVASLLILPEEWNRGKITSLIRRKKASGV